MKRSILLALMLCVTAPLIFANGGAEPEPEMMGPVEFDFWTTQTQSDRMATIQVLIDTYMALNPEVSINLVPVDENDIPTQLNAASAAGALPGLVELGAENAVAFGSEGVFDEDATGALLEEIGKDSFYQGVLRLVSSGEGGYYALPYHGWIQGIWYRADWFEEAGLDPPTTWDASSKRPNISTNLQIISMGFWWARWRKPSPSSASLPLPWPTEPSCSTGKAT
jgi:multiple sugar transport system substrate-binding protein